MKLLNVLLVDDSAEDAQLITDTLRDGGLAIAAHRVATSTLLTEALAERQWDLVIAEYLLPDLSASDTMRLLQRHQPATPLVVVSRSISEEAGIETMLSGARDYVSKAHPARLVAVARRETETSARPDQPEVEESRVGSERNLTTQLRQSERLEAVGLLAGGIAHDFNNLLMVIRGYGEMLGEEVKGTPQQEFTDEILAATDRATSLTQQLLAFSRRQAVKPETIELRELFEQQEDVLRPLLGSKISLKIQPIESDIRILADRAQVEAVLRHLSLQIKEFSPESIRLAVDITSVTASEKTMRLEPGEYVAIRCSHDGRSIPVEELSRIFEPFFRSQASTSPSLSLAVVYGILQQNRGLITALPDAAGATIFSLYFPRADPTGSKASAFNGNAKMEPPKILVVENDPGVRNILVRYLTRAGYLVTEAAHPHDALERIEEQSFDLLVTDLMLPEMNGRDLANRLLQTDPELRILFMSGHGEERLEGEGRREQDDFLLKPFSQETVLAKVKTLLTR